MVPRVPAVFPVRVPAASRLVRPAALLDVVVARPVQDTANRAPEDRSFRGITVQQPGMHIVPGGDSFAPLDVHLLNYVRVVQQRPTSEFFTANGLCHVIPQKGP